MAIIWFEKYRPTTIDEYVGPEELKNRVRQFIADKSIPHLLLYSSSPGTGKTTLAKIIARSITDDVKYINASDENGVDIVRDKIKRFAQVSSFSGMKVIILDEFDFATKEHQAALRNIMEEYATHTRFILTCNYVEKIIQPIRSRCAEIHIQPLNKTQCAERMALILSQEGVSYEIRTVATIVDAYYPDMRRMINEIERSTQNHELLNVTVKQDSFYEQIGELLSSSSKRGSAASTKKSTLSQVRQIVADNKIKDFVPMYRYLYDNIDELYETRRAEAILIIADGQFQDAFVADKEINAMATFIKLIEL